MITITKIPVTQSPLVKSYYQTPIGQICIITDNQYLYLLEFVVRVHFEQQISSLAHKLQRPIVDGETAISQQTIQELQEYFAGTRMNFSVPTCHVGTKFQQQVWQALAQIPYGETWSYKQQAQYLYNEKAIRAVAHANSLNRIAIIFPCHRVIGTNGKLTGYAAGLERKQWLLQQEQKHQSKLLAHYQINSNNKCNKS